MAIAHPDMPANVEQLLAFCRQVGIDVIHLRATFAPFFTNVRQQRSGPPYLQLDPVDLQITAEGDLALITFHLHDPGVLCRRTLLWRRQDTAAGGEWRLHQMNKNG